jgi:uncharacterized protein YecE (DUF72 family)
VPAPHRPAVCLIGCSGWQYKHWRGDFYPALLPQGRWLAHYAEQFHTVEINKYSGSYSDEALNGWAEWLADRPGTRLETRCDCAR